MKTTSILLSIISGLANPFAYGQDTVPNRTSHSPKQHFIGSSGMIIGNFFPNPPSFYQLNYGYWLTEKDVVSMEAITWKYRHPLGIPYGPAFDSPSEAYPGCVREYGLGAAYQRYFWKGLYSAVHVIPFLQKYMDQNHRKIQHGFQLFLTLRAGYHIGLFRNRFFIEPSIAFTYWPIKTNVPAPFAALDSKWPNYFLLEPGLHFGFKF